MLCPVPGHVVEVVQAFAGSITGLAWLLAAVLTWWRMR